MALPPLWKAKRELRRLTRQTSAVPSKIFDQFLTTPVYDLFQRRNVEIFDGVFPRGDRIALYLVFPSRGLLPSHKLAIEHLKKSGYAPFVVSNLPLKESDCAWLAQNTYKFLMRPNIGYDFGGYREGFLALSDELPDLEYLALFNDSAWFPTSASRNWLTQAEALDVAYAAPASSFGIPSVKFFDFRNIEWRVDVNLRNFHYCSYALLIRKEILRSDRFRRYWKKLPLTTQKNSVVRLGEIGLTKFVLRNGFSHGCTYDLNTLPDLLERCSETDINRIARGLITLGNHEASQLIEQVVPTLDARRSQSEKEDIINLILTVTARIGVSYVLPELLHQHHDFSFLKRSPLALCKRDSDIMFAFGKSLADPEGRIIEAEMQQIREQRWGDC